MLHRKQWANSEHNIKVLSNETSIQKKSGSAGEFRKKLQGSVRGMYNKSNQIKVRQQSDQNSWEAKVQRIEEEEADQAEPELMPFNRPAVHEER